VYLSVRCGDTLSGFERYFVVSWQVVEDTDPEGFRNPQGLFFLPRACFGRFAAGTGEDVIQFFQGGFAQLELQGAQGASQVIVRARADNWGSDDGVVQQPGQGHVSRLFARFHSARGFFVSRVAMGKSLDIFIFS